MKVLKLISLIFLFAVFSSCSTGPTKEEIARTEKWEKERHDNIEVMTKFLIDKIWNVPLNKLFENSHWLGKRTNFSIIHADKNISIKLINTNFKKSCNPSLPELPLVAKISYENDENMKKSSTHKYLNIEMGVQGFKDQMESSWDKKKKQYISKVTLTCPQDNEDLVKKNLAFTSLRWSLSSYYSGDSNKYLSSLKKRGMLLPREFCLINETYRSVRTKCFFDGIYAYSTLTPGIEITTHGYGLNGFRLGGLLVGNEQWDLSLSQIFEKRLQDKEHLEHMLWMTDFEQAKIDSQHAEIRRKRDESYAAEAAYKNKLKVVSDRRYKNFGKNLLAAFSEPLPGGGTGAINIPRQSQRSESKAAPLPRPQARVYSKQVDDIQGRITKAAVKRSFNNPYTASGYSNQDATDNDSEYRSEITKNGSKQNTRDKKVVDYIPIFVQKESSFSWPTKEEACTYGKAKAREVAQKQCNAKGGVQSKQRKNDINCQSYRQMDKDGFSSRQGQWKATGNIIFYCNTSK